MPAVTLHAHAVALRAIQLISVTVLASQLALAHAAEDLEFVAEHLPEVAMDNRYATLPLWSASDDSLGWRFVAQSAYSSTSTGHLTIRGPLLSLGIARQWDDRWNIGVTGFVDQLRLSGNNDYRPLQTLFAPGTPLTRPADAWFDNLDGEMNHTGLSLHVARLTTNDWIGQHRWLAGVLWERVKLSDYAFDYRVLSGPDTGVEGSIDFDGTYRHITPFAGLELPRQYDRWAWNAHALLTWPVPRRGVIGHITGPGFDIHGDTAVAGNGKHFGDPSLTLGFDVTYLPAHLTIGLGTLATQWLAEPIIHKGIDTNWLLNVKLNY